MLWDDKKNPRKQILIMLLALCLQSRGGFTPLLSPNFWNLPFSFRLLVLSALIATVTILGLSIILALLHCCSRTGEKTQRNRKESENTSRIRQWFHRQSGRTNSFFDWVINMAGSILFVDHWIRTLITFGPKMLSTFHLLEQTLKCKPYRCGSLIGFKLVTNLEIFTV